MGKPKFMNAELEAVRDHLTCAGCGRRFAGSDSQAWKVKYEKRRVFCSRECRTILIGNGRPKPSLMLCGPCKTCKRMFYSKSPKPFCSLACYFKRGRSPVEKRRAPERRPAAPRRPFSQKALAAFRERGERSRTGSYVPCLECGTPVYSKKSRPRKFCRQACYRAYLAKRFDRYVASRDVIGQMQGFDEFLDQEELPCLVHGCSWSGKHLSLHVNLTHGIPAETFKRMAGFNLGSGIISRTTSEIYSARRLVGIALLPDGPIPRCLPRAVAASASMKPFHCSLEGAEHRKKGRMLRSEESGPERICRNCGVTFTQSTPFGHAVYCTRDCRSAYYSRIRRKTNPKVRKRNDLGLFVWVDADSAIPAHG